MAVIDAQPFLSTPIIDDGLLSVYRSMCMCVCVCMRLCMCMCVCMSMCAVYRRCMQLLCLHSVCFRRSACDATAFGALGWTGLDCTRLELIPLGPTDWT